MSVLKIRDENGNFIPINAIKGDRGERGLPGAGVGVPISPTKSEIFNDYENNTTNIPYAHIEGKNNKAVIKCFLIQSNDDYTVTLDSAEGIKEGMTVAMFYPVSGDDYERIRGRVGNVSGNTVTVILGTGQKLPAITPSTAGTFLNTFIVDGGSIGTTVIEDDVANYFSLHMHGSDNTGYMNALVSGSGNKVKSLYGVALGYKGVVEAERGFTANYKNKITSSGFESAAFGMNNEVGAAAAFAGGRDNKTHEGADGSLNFGRYNNVYAAWAAALGHGLEARDGSCLYAGCYNEHVDKLRLCIGNGKSDTERSNAMTVDWYGNMEVAGDIKFKGQSLEQLFDDIESGLDRIIEVQDSLIGGGA